MAAIHRTPTKMHGPPRHPPFIVPDWLALRLGIPNAPLSGQPGQAQYGSFAEQRSSFDDTRLSHPLPSTSTPTFGSQIQHPQEPTTRPAKMPRQKYLRSPNQQYWQFLPFVARHHRHPLRRPALRLLHPPFLHPRRPTANEIHRAQTTTYPARIQRVGLASSLRLLIVAITITDILPYLTCLREMFENRSSATLQRCSMVR